MAFPDSFLRELVERSDIEDVVSGYVRLTKKSAANIFGLCPFHSEKTPSFSVNPDKQIFYCFGCGKGGGVISFIMEAENLSFPDAVRHLARRAGMTVPEDSGEETLQRRERLLSLNREAARFFHDRLKALGGEEARAYINARGISAAMARVFGLGFAPDTWDALKKEMLARGYGENEMLDAGLCRKSQNEGGGAYDAFRGRLMFPVIDVRGDVVGFSGRILGRGEPKYINSPETAVYNKSRNLFALNLAKKSKSGYIILSEGNIDVVALHQAGFDSAVASLGTSLTPEQARLILRYSKKVVIAYDSDEAGQKAATRAAGILEKSGVEVRILKMGESKDPDEFLKKHGAHAFRKLIDGSENHVEYRLGNISKKYDLELDEGKVGFLREFAQVIAQLESAAEREVYAMRAAELTEISTQAVLLEVARSRKRRVAEAKQKEENKAMRLERALQPKKRDFHYDNIRSAIAEEGILRLLCLDPPLILKRRDIPSPEDFSSSFLGRIYAELLSRAKEGEQLHIGMLEGALSPEEISHLTAVLQKPEALSNGERALTDYINIVNSEAGKAEKFTGVDYKGQEYSQLFEMIKETKKGDKGERYG